MPRISVVIPCFDAAATLAETLESLRRQTYGDWEAICVDDGSRDDTVRVIEQAAARDGRVRLAGHAGKGPSAARNAGALAGASGEIVAFCDADDLWTADKLSRVVDVFGEARTDAVFGQVAFYAGGDRSAAMRRSRVPAGPLGIAQLLGENPVCTMSNLSIRRARFAQSGGFDEGIVHNEDLEWLIRLLGEGARVVGDPALHVLYRASPGGLSADLAPMVEGRRRALDTAARYGVRPDPRAEAVFARYLARRALRVGHDRTAALRFALAGLAASPRGFLSPARRGAATLAAAAVTPLLPGALRRALFTA
jgi:glycosyltransferase involved in cell wall biosynthesis